MSRIATILASALVLAEPCIPTGNLDPKGETADTGGPDDSQGMGPCESGLCDLTVADAIVDCATDTTSVPYPLEATVADGVISVWHHRVQQGCCPELAVSAIQDLSNDRIDVEYDLYDDMCDCICDLDIRYSLSDAYSGTFTLYAGSDSVEVTVQ